MLVVLSKVQGKTTHDVHRIKGGIVSSQPFAAVQMTTEKNDRMINIFKCKYRFEILNPGGKLTKPLWKMFLRFRGFHILLAAFSLRN